VIEQHAERHHAAHRESAEMALRDAEHVENAHGIGHQHVERIVALRRRRAAVAARVVAQHAVATFERVRKLVPHRQVGREPMREHHPGPAPAVDATVKGRSVACDLHDCLRESLRQPS